MERDPADPVGQQFAGRYRVDRLLARGGSGQVFAGHDLVMNRAVAIKLLTPEAVDPVREARLEVEARVNGALPHPNVVAVFDIGQHEGAPFIVSEYLEGETLRDRLSRGPLPPDVAVDGMLQLARGLAAAHERGVVHCDLKPENVFVTRDGWMKILDFGIARKQAADATETEEGAAQAPTFSGTVGYAAPEQLQGAPPDRRWDVFALGAVAYEMVTGKRAFGGATRDERRDATLRAELPAWKAPRTLKRVVERCLAKNPEERFATAREVVEALEKLAKRPRWRFRFAAIGGALVAVIAAVFVVRTRPSEITFKQVTFHPGAVWTARFDPSGQRAWYTEAWDGAAPRIFSTGFDQTQLPRLEVDKAVLASLSLHDELAILSAPRFESFDYRGTLSIIPAPGGAPRAILDNVDYADWFPDGQTLAVVRRDGARSRLEAPPGHVLVESVAWIGQPRVSPKGDLIAYIDHPRLTESDGSIAVVDLQGKVRQLAGGWHTAEGLAWSPSGDEVWFSAGAPNEAQPVLRAVTLDGNQRVLARAAANLRLLDTGKDGRVLMTEPQNYIGLAVAGSHGESDLSWLDQSILNDISADGSSVLFTVHLTSGRVGPLYVRNTDGSTPVRLAEQGMIGALSPDGRWVVAVPTEGPRKDLQILPTGAGPSRTLDAAGLDTARARFFPDGKRLALAAHEAGHGLRLYVRDLSGGAPVPISGEGISFRWFAVSTSGDFVAARDSSGGIVLLDPSGRAPARKVAATLPDEVPFSWLDGDILLVGKPLDIPARIFAIDVHTGARTLWQTLEPHAPGAFGLGRIFASADGKVLAYNYTSAKTHLYLFEGVR